MLFPASPLLSAQPPHVDEVIDHSGDGVDAAESFVECQDVRLLVWFSIPSLHALQR